MKDVLLKEKGDILLCGQVSDVTPIGVACDVELDDMGLLRDGSGKYKELGIEVTVRAHDGGVTVLGSGNVYSVRRISQGRCIVTIRFKELEQNGYRLISEHLSPNAVLNMNDIEPARQSRMA